MDRRSPQRWVFLGALPPGRPGDPDNDDGWFVTDWMDTTRAQEALEFQHYSWPDVLAELQGAGGGGNAIRVGWSHRLSERS